MSFGIRLRELRRDRGMAATTLGPIAGVSPKTLYRYEAGDQEPTLSVLIRLADALHVTLDSLVDRQSPRVEHASLAGWGPAPPPLEVTVRVGTRILRAVSQPTPARDEPPTPGVGSAGCGS